MKKMSKIVVGGLALTMSLSANAGFWRWTSYSKANCFALNTTVAWWNEHPQLRLTESIHYDNRGSSGDHFLTTGWETTDVQKISCWPEASGPQGNRWHVQGYNYYFDISRGSVYDWFSDAFDCNLREDFDYDYPQR